MGVGRGAGTLFFREFELSHKFGLFSREFSEFCKFASLVKTATSVSSEIAAQGLAVQSVIMW